MIYAGGGVIHAEASAQLRAFANAYRIPTVATLMGLGCYDTTDPLSLHMLGMHGTAYANYAVEDCDFLITLGARFDDRVAGVPDKFAPRAKAVAHFDIDPAEISKNRAADVPIVGSVKEIIPELTEAVRALQEKDGGVDLAVADEFACLVGGRGIRHVEGVGVGEGRGGLGGDRDRRAVVALGREAGPEDRGHNDQEHDDGRDDERLGAQLGADLALGDEPDALAEGR